MKMFQFRGCILHSNTSSTPSMVTHLVEKASSPYATQVHHTLSCTVQATHVMLMIMMMMIT